MRILVHPDPVLRQKAQVVDPKSDTDLPRLIERMTRTMQEASGVGLAAPQIGVQKAVIVYSVDDEPRALCNPVIVESSPEKVVEEEGCLSVPGINVGVERPASVVCEGVSAKGELLRIEAGEFLARVLQHEIDHLNGVLIIDRATPEERREALTRYMSQAG